MVAAWWDKMNEGSREGFYLLFLCVGCMPVGKTLEVRSRDSGGERALEARVVPMDPVRPENHGVRGGSPDCNSGQGVAVGRCCVWEAYHDGGPRVPKAYVDGWWKGMTLETREKLFVMGTWFRWLKGGRRWKSEKGPEGRCSFCHRVSCGRPMRIGVTGGDGRGRMIETLKL
jgi:hypothetical protein